MQLFLAQISQAGVEHLASFLRQDKTLQTLQAQNITTPSFYTAEPWSNDVFTTAENNKSITRWALTSYKWSHNPHKSGYKTIYRGS